MMQLHELKKVDFSKLGSDVCTFNEVLIDKVKKSCGYEDDDEAKGCVIEALKFLFLVGASNTRLTPAHYVDMAWHELILFTRFYADFCQKHFGKYIHHHPGGTQEENRNDFKKTLKLYALYIGEPPVLFWGPGAESFQGDAECGT